MLDNTILVMEMLFICKCSVDYNSTDILQHPKSAARYDEDGKTCTSKSESAACNQRHECAENERTDDTDEQNLE